MKSRERVHVQSSVLRWVEFDSKSSTLRVEFTTGKVYDYQKVPAVRVKALLKAESIGRYFNRFIRDHYAYEIL